MTVFIRPEVSGLLAKTVETWLHTDKPSLPKYDRILELKERLTNVQTNPVYLVLDPTTEEVLGRLDGATSIEGFRTWLEESLGASSK